mgnify:CR=1 FL=1
MDQRTERAADSHAAGAAARRALAGRLGLDPFEIRLKNANRIADTSPNQVVYTDPSTVPTIQSIAEAMGVELAADYRTMTNAPREGSLLPEHLVGQIGNPEAH